MELRNCGTASDDKGAEEEDAEEEGADDDDPEEKEKREYDMVDIVEIGGRVVMKRSKYHGRPSSTS